MSVPGAGEFLLKQLGSKNPFFGGQTPAQGAGRGLRNGPACTQAEVGVQTQRGILEEPSGQLLE